VVAGPNKESNNLAGDSKLTPPFLDFFFPPD